MTRCTSATACLLTILLPCGGLKQTSEGSPEGSRSLMRWPRLAYGGSRSDFFRSELLYALRIIDRGHISADKMLGSWAGATGQLQFMPSTFYSYAVDYNGDGRIDIWNNLEDILASAANYLSRSGWVRDQPWGWEVSSAKDFDRTLAGLDNRKSLEEWEKLGVQPPSRRKREEQPPPGLVRSWRRTAKRAGPLWPWRTTASFIGGTALTTLWSPWECLPTASPPSNSRTTKAAKRARVFCLTGDATNRNAL